MKIKSFVQWYNEQTKGTYIAFKLSEQSNKNIINYCRELSLENPIKEDDIHITLIYSRKYIPELKIGTYSDFDKQECVGKELKLFGDTLVLVLDSDFCKETHEEFMDKYNATYDFDEYIPHVTLGYNVKELPAQPKEAIDVEIVKLYVEDLNLNWNDRYKDE